MLLHCRKHRGMSTLVFETRNCLVTTSCGPQSAASAIAVSVSSQGSWLDSYLQGMPTCQVLILKG